MNVAVWSLALYNVRIRRIALKLFCFYKDNSISCFVDILFIFQHNVDTMMFLCIYKKKRKKKPNTWLFGNYSKKSFDWMLYKTLDTFGNCQRPVFSLSVSQHVLKITNLWTFELNLSSKLRDTWFRDLKF